MFKVFAPILRVAAVAFDKDPSFKARTLRGDRKSTRLNSSHAEIYTLSLHDALPIYEHSAALNVQSICADIKSRGGGIRQGSEFQGKDIARRSEEHTSELQSRRDLHSFPTRRSSDLRAFRRSECSKYLRRY